MTLYRGRIQADHRGLMDAINRSLPVDIRLLPYDLAVNRAWATELQRIGVLSESEQRAIQQALGEIETMAGAGAFSPPPADEDVHTLVERLLTEKIGEAGAKIHTGRSRNDQAACDLRMYTGDRLKELMADLSILIHALKELGDEHAETLLAGTTHLQPAQPITLGHFLLSLGFGLIRDLQRLREAQARTRLCPLGAGALGGSAFPVDRRKLARALGFDSICENALDAVGDRDFAQETVSACAILCAHLSRYAEQFIIWSSPAYGYMRFADEWSTGSSMMPQKKNPDAMELVRAKAARCLGNLTTLLSLTKGLPPAYSKDLQEDKAPLFDALDTTLLCVRVFTPALASAQFMPERMAAGLSGDLLATDLADALVRAGVPFRQAHEAVSSFISKLEKESRDLTEVHAEELTGYFPQLVASAFSLGFTDAVARRDVAGGTAPDRVREQARNLAAMLVAAMNGQPNRQT